MPSTINPTIYTAGVPAVKEEAAGELTKIANKLYGAINLKDCGAALDGSTDDSSAFQEALNAAAAGYLDGNSRIFVPGRCKFDPGSLDWSAFTTSSPKRRLTIVVDGTLLVMSTLVISHRMGLLGLGGAGSLAQFQIRTACVVQQSGTWTEPVIKMIGGSDQWLENVYVPQPYGPGIQVGYSEGDGGYPAGEGPQSALMRLVNVGVALRPSVATSEGIRIENCFWVWISNFGLTGATGAGSPLHIADSFQPKDGVGTGNTTGLLSVRDGVIAHKGIEFSRASGVNQIAYHLWFHNIHFESLIAPMVLINSASVNLDDIKLDHLASADPVSGEGLLLDNSVKASIGVVTVRGMNTVGPGNRHFLGPIKSIDNGNAFRSFVYGSQGYREYEELPFKFRRVADGETEQCDGFRGGDLAPSMLPSDVKVILVDQAISGWTLSNCSVAADVAPDGSSTSHKLTFSAAGSAYKDSGMSGVTDHFIVMGCWYRATTLTSFITDQAAPVFGLHLLSVTSPYWDDDTGITTTTWNYDRTTARHAQQKAGWMLLSQARKLNSSASSTFRFQMVSDKAQSYLAWKPFVLAFPASAYTRRDISRFLSKLAFVDGGAKPGVLAQLPHQTFRTGAGATGARPSASDVGAGAQWFDTTIGKPIWSTGSAWVLADGSDPDA